jgi:hypothetical protein
VVAVGALASTSAINAPQKRLGFSAGKKVLLLFFISAVTCRRLRRAVGYLYPVTFVLFPLLTPFLCVEGFAFDLFPEVFLRANSVLPILNFLFFREDFLRPILSVLSGFSQCFGFDFGLLFLFEHFSVPPCLRGKFWFWLLNSRSFGLFAAQWFLICVHLAEICGKFWLWLRYAVPPCLRGDICLSEAAA